MEWRTIPIPNTTIRIQSINTKDLSLIIVKNNFSNKVLDYYIRNRESFKTWEPVRQEVFYTQEYHRTALKSGLKKVKDGKEFRFMIFDRNDFNYNKIVGILTFSNIVKGPFLSCFAGYSIDNLVQNKGYMSQALKSGIKFMFETIGLHRIEANIMPRNISSLKVVTKLGFKNEGLSPKYLKINGHWEDHIHMVLRNKDLE